MIRVAILDNDAKFRRSLGMILGKVSDISVVAEAGSNLDGIKALEGHKPDVILMDSNEPFTDALENTKQVISRFPNSTVIILSNQPGSTLTATLCKTWACYHLCKKCSAKEILAAIREGLPQGNGRVAV